MINYNPKKNTPIIINLILYLYLLSNLIGSALPAFLVSASFLPFKFKHKKKILIYSSIILIFVTLYIFIVSGKQIFSNILFYFAYIPTLLLISNSLSQDQIIKLCKKFLTLSFLICACEFIASNTGYVHYVWYFPLDHIHRVNISGYERILGIGNTSSATGSLSALLFISISESEKKIKIKYLLFCILNILFSFSTSGFVLLTVYFILTKLYVALIPIIFLFFMPRINYDYIYNVYQVKLLALNDFHEFALFRYETLSNVITSSDNSFYNIAKDFGLIPLVLIVIFPYFLVY